MRAQIVVIGASLGGLHALSTFFRGLPADFEPPIVIVQHRRATSQDGLSAMLQKHCPLPIREPMDKAPIQPGYVYLAPADYHLLVEDGLFTLSIDAKVAHSRPSIDVLFESVADAFGAGAIGIILSGANSDGAQGIVAIKSSGGVTIAQEPGTAECASMPQAAVGTGRVDYVLPLEKIAGRVLELCGGTAHSGVQS